MLELYSFILSFTSVVLNEVKDLSCIREGRGDARPFAALRVTDGARFFALLRMND
jgi:hypothetical protein